MSGIQGVVWPARPEYSVKHHPVKVPGEQAQQEPSQPASTPPATPPESGPEGARPPSPEPATEPGDEPPPEAGIIDLASIESDEELTNIANEILVPLTKKELSSLSDVERTNFDNLMALLTGKVKDKKDNISLSFGQEPEKPFLGYDKNAKHLVVGTPGNITSKTVGIPSAMEGIKIKISKKQTKRRA